MDWNSIWTNLVSNGIWALLILGGGIGLAYLRAKHADKVPAVLYGLLGATCFAILIFTFTGRAIFAPRPQIQTTTSNVEERIKGWSEGFGFSIAKALPSPPNAYFGLVITLGNGNPIAISRINQLPNYIQFQTPLVLSPEHQAALTKLTKAQADAVVQEIVVDLTMAKMGYQIVAPQGSSQQMQSIVLSKQVPIDDLTESRYLAYINDMDDGITLVRAAMVMALKHNGQLLDAPVVTQHSPVIPPH